MAGPRESDALQWHLIVVRSHGEKKVAKALHRKGLEVFLPTHRERRQWSDRVKEFEVPLFACNLFCRYCPKDQMRVLSTPGVFSDLAAGSRPVPIPDAEVAHLERVLGSSFRVEPWPNPSSGAPVRIRHKAFSRVQGHVAQRDGTSLVIITLGATQSTLTVEVPKDLTVSASEVRG